MVSLLFVQKTEHTFISKLSHLFQQFFKQQQKACLRLALLLMSMGIVGFSFGQEAATVQTDKLDYPPGDTVWITGNGFMPGETVELQVLHEGDDPFGTDSAYHHHWDVVADLQGKISGYWVVPVDGDALGATFILSADGQTSGRHAETIFTDGPTIDSISPLSGSVSGGTTVTITGAGFQGSVVVTFGGVLATNVVVASNNKSLTCVTPANSAGAVDVVVTVTAGGGNSGSITSVGGFTYIALSQTISFTNPGTKTYGDADFNLGATASSGLTVSYTIVNGPATIISGNMLHITGAGNVTVRASQAGDGTYASATNVDRTFSVNKATATVTVTPYSVTYDGVAHTSTYSITGVNGETGATVGTIDVSATTHTNAGTYNGDVWSFTGTSNYNNTNGTVNNVIAKAPTTISIIFGNLVYNGDSKAATATVTGAGGLNQALTITYVGTGATGYGPSTTAPSLAGTYSASASFAEAANYLASSKTENFTIVAASTTTTLITSAPSVRYMDNLTMTARISPDPYVAANPLTGTVQFKIGGVNYGSPVAAVPVPGSPAGMLEATLIVQVAEMPGNYTVEAVFSSSNANYDGSSNTKPLTVVARDADPYDAKGFYTGDVFAWTTGPNSSKGTVTMTAMIKDKNDPKGDVRGAKITFCYVNNGVWTPIPSAKDLPVGLVDINDGSVGYASAIVQFDIGSQNAANYQIGVLVTGAYSNEDLLNCGLSQVIVSVSKPIPGGFICGGSRLINPATTQLSSGYIKGAPGLCTDYQFDVQYTKSGTNPKGKVKIMINSYYTRDGILDNKLHTYIVTTNAIASMNVVAPTGTFSAKANLVEQFDGYVEAIEGGSTFQMTAYQNGCDQKLAITLYRKAGGIWFSNSWDGTKTLLQPVATGSKVYVGGAAPCSLTSVKTGSITVTDSPIRSTIKEVSDVFNVKVLGNPSLTNFRLQLNSDDQQQKITVKVVDVNGRVIEVKQNLYAGQVIELGTNYKQGTYFAEVTQGTNRKVVKLLKVAIE